MKKGFILGFVIAVLITTGIVFAAEMLNDVYISTFPIKLNGQPYKAEMPVLNYQGRTYLALREFGTVTGNEVDFQNNTIIINNSNQTSNSTKITNATQNTNITLGKTNALKSAKNYLSIMAFSKSGLKRQLEFEGYSEEEAEYAVNNCEANWDEQAAKSAKNYMSIMSFSKNGLIEQLEFEGFTNSQAQYGASAVGY